MPGSVAWAAWAGWGAGGPDGEAYMDTSFFADVDIWLELTNGVSGTFNTTQMFDFATAECAQVQDGFGGPLSDQIIFTKTDLGNGAYRISTAGALDTDPSIRFDTNQVWTRVSDGAVVATGVDHIDVTAPGVYAYTADSADASLLFGSFHYFLRFD